MHEPETRVSDESPLSLVATLIGSVADALNLRHLRSELSVHTNDPVLARPTRTPLTRVSGPPRPPLQVTLPRDVNDAYEPTPSSAVFGRRA